MSYWADNSWSIAASHHYFVIWAVICDVKFLIVSIQKCGLGITNHRMKNILGLMGTMLCCHVIRLSDMVPGCQLWYLAVSYGTRQSDMVPGCDTWHQAVRHGTRLSDMVPGSQTWCQAVRHSTRLSDMVLGCQTWCQAVRHGTRLSDMVPGSQTWYQAVLP